MIKHALAEAGTAPKRFLPMVPKDHPEGPECTVLREGWSHWEVDWADKSLSSGAQLHTSFSCIIKVNHSIKTIS